MFEGPCITCTTCHQKIVGLRPNPGLEIWCNASDCTWDYMAWENSGDFDDGDATVFNGRSLDGDHTFRFTFKFDGR